MKTSLEERFRKFRAVKKRKLLTPEERKANYKEYQRKYFLKNRERLLEYKRQQWANKTTQGGAE